MALVHQGHDELQLAPLVVVPSGAKSLPNGASRVVEQWQLTALSAQAALEASPYLPLRLLRCDYHEGVLAIRGRVPTYYLKQLAQTVVSRVAGVEQVANRVEVIPPGEALRSQGKSAGEPPRTPPPEL